MIPLPSAIRFGGICFSKPQPAKTLPENAKPAIPTEATQDVFVSAPSASLQKALRNLQDWDRRTHPTAPVILSMKTNQIVQKRPRQTNTPYLILIAGGSASGKSTHCEYLKQSLPQCEHLPLDNYFIDISDTFKKMGPDAFFRDYLRDTPDNMDLPLATTHIASLKNGQTTHIPKAYARMTDAQPIHPKPFLLAEGLLTLQHEPLQQLANLCIFLETSEQARTDRFYQRMHEGGRKRYSPEIDAQRLANVLKCHNIYIEPSKAKADIVINASASKEAIQATLKQLVQLLETEMRGKITA